MRRPMFFRLAMLLLTWIGGGGAYSEAMSGDMLEEFARTGNAGRFWREILGGVLRGVWRRSGELLQPVMFSVGWSLIYPVWQTIEGGRVWPALAQRSFAMEWPYSSVTLLASAGLSPLLFVWGGGLLYMTRTLRRDGQEVTWLRLLPGLSLSLSVLLVSGMVLLTKRSDGFGTLGEQGAPVFGLHLTGMSVCLTLSLMAATMSVRPLRLRRRLS